MIRGRRPDSTEHNDDLDAIALSRLFRPSMSGYPLCYNAASTMKHRTIVRGLGAFAALVVVAALIAPLAGPVLDHHFAERQPDHLHIGAPHSHDHSHAFESSHHSHPLSSVVDGDRLPITLYKSDGGVAATLAASPVDVEASSVRRFQPTSAFAMPSPPVSAARQHTPAPPDKPPTHLL